MSESFLDLHVEDIEAAADMFKALADSNRLKVMYLLLNRHCSVNQITERLSMSQQGVSALLRKLRYSNLVFSRNEGQNRIYSLSNEHVMRLMQEAISMIKSNKT